MLMNPDNGNPFHLSNKDAYRCWREQKLDFWQKAKIRPIQISDPEHLTLREHQEIYNSLNRFNMSVFKIREHNISHATLKTFASQFGLHRLDNNLYADHDNISELRAIKGQRRGEYIPYTNRPLGWHTDGYYNHPDKTIRAFILYCVNNAASGGANQLFDPDLAYIHIRDKGDDYIEALMQPDTFSIPQTIEGDKNVRPRQDNAVFQDDADGLLMRYTQRKAHIRWKSNEITQAARVLLSDLLAKGSKHVLNICLQPGEGLICNNVLHNRSAFTDDERHPRVMLRARYYDSCRKILDA